MKFWDASAIVPLLVEERSSRACRALLERDHDVLAWALSPVEASSALYRKERAGKLSAAATRVAHERLRALSRAWVEVQALVPVRDRAQRLLAVHDLRAADSLQLAAALVATDERPHLIDFVCLDTRLSTAATREGFAVVLGT